MPELPEDARGEGAAAETPAPTNDHQGEAKAPAEGGGRGELPSDVAAGPPDGGTAAALPSAGPAPALTTEADRMGEGTAAGDAVAASGAAAVDPAMGAAPDGEAGDIAAARASPPAPAEGAAEEQPRP